jgi:hypothetical protein
MHAASVRAADIQETQMASAVFRIERSMEWVLGLEVLFFAFVAARTLHQNGLHGALATTIAIVGGVILLVAVIRVRTVFWAWTAWISWLVAYIAFSATREGTKDLLWALFAGALAIVLILGLHVASREHWRSHGVKWQ